MPSPLFEFFEVVAEELSAVESMVLTREDLQARDGEAPILDDLKRELAAASTDEAITLAVEQLRSHFDGKGSRLPFDYDSATGRFTAVDGAFLQFVNKMRSIRSLGKRSQEFECSVAERLSLRATGEIHRVGHPRATKKTKAEFNAHLKTLGFDRPVLLGAEKDGGLDILWVLPMGTIPHRPLVSVQCKNGLFNIQTADQSLGAGSRSFSQHTGLQPTVHVPCVLFNDYISPKTLTQKPLQFVPLGLTDLAPMRNSISLHRI